MPESFDRKPQVSPVLFLVTSPDVELTTGVLKAVDAFLCGKNEEAEAEQAEASKTSGAHIVIKSLTEPIQEVGSFREVVDEIHDELERRTNVVLWLSPDLISDAESAFFFHDVKELHIGGSKKRRSGSLHVDQTQCESVEEGMKAVLTLLGRFASLPLCHWPLKESFELMKQRQAEAKQREANRLVAKEAFAHRCQICGGLSCGSVQRFLFALPKEERQAVMEEMEEMQRRGSASLETAVDVKDNALLRREWQMAPKPETGAEDVKEVARARRAWQMGPAAPLDLDTPI